MAHGWGPELGDGEMQVYWRAAGELFDKLVVTSGPPIRFARRDGGQALA